MNSPSISFDGILQANENINSLQPTVLNTPLLPVEHDSLESLGITDLYVKCENLQPIGSFKVRGAVNAMASLSANTNVTHVWTASAGNWAQGLAWGASQLQRTCTVVVPDHAPAAKLDAIHRLGGKTIPVSFDKWWKIIEQGESAYDDLSDAKFFHPVVDSDVIHGNGTVGLEIVRQLPDVDAVITPYGGGGLSCGVATAIRHLKPGTRLYASEVSTAAPLHAALNAKPPSPITIEYESTFVDGIGGKSVLKPIWPLASSLLDASLVCTPNEIASAIKVLAERTRTIAEGAGASSLAAALSGKAGKGKIVCVISGGCIDAKLLAAILLNDVENISGCE